MAQTAAPLDRSQWPAIAYHPSRPPVEVRSPAEFDALPDGYALGLDGYRASLGLEAPAEDEATEKPARDTTTRLSQRKR